MIKAERLGLLMFQTSLDALAQAKRAQSANR
jgi:hypothetical protein